MPRTRRKLRSVTRFSAVARGTIEWARTPADIGWAPAWGKHRGYGWQAFGVSMMFIAAVLASGGLLGVVSPHAKYPFLPVKVWHLIYEIPQSISAGIVEELVVVALLVTVLEQARTKVWVIYVVGLTLRLSYHVYYGWGVIVFLLWAATAIWLFRRTRRITPLIVAHMVYDSFGSFYHEIPHPPAAVGALIGWAVFGLVITGILRAIQIATHGHRAAGHQRVAVGAAAHPLDCGAAGLKTARQHVVRARL